MTMPTLTDTTQSRYPASWNPYLSRAVESGAAMEPTATALELIEEPAAILIEQLFDSLAARLCRGSGAERLTVDWDFIDLGEHHRMILSGGDLVHWPSPTARADADLTLTVTRAQLSALVGGAGLDGLVSIGDPATRRRLAGLLDPTATDRAVESPPTEPPADPVDPRAGQRRRPRATERSRVAVGSR